MDTLTQNVSTATALKPEVARAAIVQVLLFLRDEMPKGQFAEFIDRLRQARDAVEAAGAARVSPTAAALDGLSSVMDRTGPDVSNLAGELMKLGLDETQVVRLMDEVILRAEALVGSDDAGKIRRILPLIIEHLHRRVGPTHPTAS